MRGPTFSGDITSILAIESAFQNLHLKDPFAVELAGLFADCFIFSERMRFSMPVVTTGKGVPKILQEFISADNKCIEICEIPHSSFPVPKLESFNLEKVISSTNSWLRGFSETWKCQNLVKAKEWIRFQGSSFVAASHASRTGTQKKAVLHEYILDKSDYIIEQIFPQFGISKQEFVYLIDNLIRGVSYEELAENHSSVLFHPLRMSVPLPHRTVNLSRTKPSVRDAFRLGIQRMIADERLSMNGYIKILLRIRNLVHMEHWMELSEEEIGTRINREKEKLGFPMMPNSAGITLAGSLVGAAFGAATDQGPVQLAAAGGVIAFGAEYFVQSKLSDVVLYPNKTVASAGRKLKFLAVI